MNTTQHTKGIETMANHGTARVYFFRNGKELVDHPANGMAYQGCSCSVAKFGTSSVHRMIFVSKGYGPLVTYSLTEADFGGPVQVKTWFTVKEYTTMIGLADKSTAVAAGATPTEHDCDQPLDGRGQDFKGWAPFSELVAE